MLKLPATGQHHQNTIRYYHLSTVRHTDEKISNVPSYRMDTANYNDNINMCTQLQTDCSENCRGKLCKETWSFALETKRESR